MSSLQMARKATVALRRIRGSYPLINLVRRRSYRQGVVAIDDYDGDLRISLDLNEHMASQIFWFGFYSRDVVALLKQRLRPGDVFLDGGANKARDSNLLVLWVIDGQIKLNSPNKL